MEDPEVVVRGFDRPNIRLEVVRHERAEHKRRALLDRVEEADGRGAGIVYCATKKGAEEVAERAARARRARRALPRRR